MIIIGPMFIHVDGIFMIDHIIIPRTHDLGNFEVYRALPSKEKQMVGPFIFWDQMGPGEFLTGHGLDVRPHPHIGLATLTYLFTGEINHQDSLGNNQIIYPGDVNLMSAGQGIVHSERTPAPTRLAPHSLFGIQSWLALPLKEEDQFATFTHIDKDHLPLIQEKGFNVRVIAGSYGGVSSPMELPHDTLYLDITLQKGESVLIPKDAEERALYLLNGDLSIHGITYPPHQLLILSPGQEIPVTANRECHFMVLGGAVMDGPRYIWWNFVASSREQIEEAKHRWQEKLFPMIPGETEFIPLPSMS